MLVWPRLAILRLAACAGAAPAAAGTIALLWQASHETRLGASDLIASISSLAISAGAMVGAAGLVGRRAASFGDADARRLLARARRWKPPRPARPPPPLDPGAFEQWCAARLRALAWRADVVGRPGDLGVDVRAIRDGRVLALQCKAFRRPAGVRCVQEVFVGRIVHRADQAAVVCVAGFTRPARDLAARVGVFLLLPDEMERL